MNALTVSVRPRPFSPAVFAYPIKGGMSVAQIVAAAPLDRAFLGEVVVRINDNFIEPEFWRCTRIRSLSHSGEPIIVTVDPLPQGKGAKQLLSIVGAIAITLGTAWIGGGGLALFLGSGFAAGTIGAQVAAGIFGFVGALALQALAPPPLSPNQQRDIKSKQLAGVSANVPALLEQIPCVLGKMRVSPPLLVPPHTFLAADGDTIVSFVVGLSGQHLIQDIRLNGAKIADMEKVEYETREGWADDDPLTLSTLTVLEERPQAKLDEFELKGSNAQEDWIEDQGTPNNSVPAWQTFATRGEADQVIIRFFWPQGMIFVHEGTFDESAFPIRVQIRIDGDVDWINLPEFHFHNKGTRQKELRQQIQLIWNDVSPTFAPDDGKNAYVAFWDAAPGRAWEWLADSYFDPGGGSIYPERVTNDVNKLGWIVYLDPGTFPKGKYEVRIKRGLAYKVDQFSYSSATYSHSFGDEYANFFDFFDDSGTIKVRIPQREFSATCLLEAFSTIRNDYPLVQEELTLVAVTAVNVQISSVSFLATRYAPVIDAGDWTVDYEPTQNPAAMLREVWTGSLNAQAKDLAIVDDDNLEDFYNDCESNSYQCNAIVEAGQSVKAIAQLIAATGYAAIAEFEKWGVVMDRDRSGDAITQLYTPLNTKNFRVERSFADVPHALKVEYVNKDDDFKLTEHVVYRDGYDAMSATLFEGIRYIGFTTEASIEARATRDLRQLFLRDMRFVFETGLENLRTPQGALCGLTHDILASSAFFSYTTGKTIVTGDVTEIQLEAVVDFAAALGDAIHVGAQIRLRDGSIIVKRIDETTASNVATFTTPFANTADLETGCLVGFGPLASETRRVVVLDIEQLDDDRARLTCLDEAPAVYA